MRQGQQNRRGRGRTNNNPSTSTSTSNNNNNSNNNGRKPQNALSRTYESSGPDVKIRGTAAQIAEKYITLARDASSASDVVMTENYLQHAEHYNRIIMAAQAQAQAQAQVQQPPQQPSLSHHSHENTHVSGNPQRISPDGNGTMREQPQPLIQPALALEEGAAPEANAEQGQQQPVQGRDADGSRRRRRRYPVNGTADRAAAPAEATPAANGADIVSSDHSTDEALA